MGKILCSRGAFAQARGECPRASRWCSIQCRQSREHRLVSSFRRPSQRRDWFASQFARRLERQFRLAACIAPCWRVRRRRGRARKAPSYRRSMMQVLANDDLRRATRTVVPRQEDAVLKLDLVVEGLKGPDVAVGQDQHDAPRVAEAACLDRRMEMKPQY